MYLQKEEMKESYAHNYSLSLKLLLFMLLECNSVVMVGIE